MAHVIASHRLRFVDAEGPVELVPSTLAQSFPDRFVGTPYFQAASQSGWVTVVDLEPKAEAKDLFESIVEGYEPPASAPAPRKKRNVIS